MSDTGAAYLDGADNIGWLIFSRAFGSAILYIIVKDYKRELVEAMFNAYMASFFIPCHVSRKDN